MSRAFLSLSGILSKVILIFSFSLISSITLLIKVKLSIPRKHQGEFNDFNGDMKSYVISYNIDDAVNALCEGIEWYNSTLN